MEQINNTTAMLDLISQSAFCVKDGIIAGVNQAARQHMITEGTTIADLLLTGSREYSEFSNGCLYLTLTLSGTSFGASVTRTNDLDIFILEQEEDQAELQAMALAAQELRQPLTSIMTVADHLFPLTESQLDPSMQAQVARINRGLFQMLRIISNMSDAYRYSNDAPTRQETRDISGILDEIFQSTKPLVTHAGLQLNYTGLKESIFGLVDAEKLERAVNNILSNALKFSPVGGSIDARLTRKGTMLYLTVQNGSSGMEDDIRKNIFDRFRREPGIEDGRYGIGLGMVLLRAAAAAHGGTVLIEQNPEWGTRITMTISIRQSSEPTVHNHLLRVDYAGERDHRLLELSESLPADLYQKQQ